MVIALFSAVICLGVVQALMLVGLFWGLVELRAMQKSTHSVQLVPTDQSFQKMTEDLKQTLQKDIFDNVG